MADKAPMSRSRILEFVSSQFLNNTRFPATIIQLILSYWEVHMVDGKYERKTTDILKGPIGVAVGGQGRDMIIAVAEYEGNRVQILRYHDLSVIKVIGTGKPGSGPHQLSSPHEVLIVGNELFVADTNNNRVQIFNLKSIINGGEIKAILTIGGKGKKENFLQYPQGLAIRHNKNELFILERAHVSVWDYHNGNFLREWGKEEQEFSLNFSYMCISPNEEEVFISDTGHNIIKIYNANDGKFIRKIGESFLSGPRGIAVNETYVYVSDYNSFRILVLNMNGEVIKTFGSQGKEDGQFVHAFGIALTSDRLVVSDYSNGRVQFFE